VKLDPRTVRFVTPTLLSAIVRRVPFVGRENAVQLHETALVVEGHRLKIRFLGLELLFGPALGEWSAVTVPYARIARARAVPVPLLRLLAVLYLWLLPLFIMGPPPGHWPPEAAELLAAAGAWGFAAFILVRVLDVWLWPLLVARGPAQRFFSVATLGVLVGACAWAVAAGALQRAPDAWGLVRSRTELGDAPPTLLLRLAPWAGAAALLACVLDVRPWALSARAGSARRAPLAVTGRVLLGIFVWVLALAVLQRVLGWSLGWLIDAFEFGTPMHHWFDRNPISYQRGWWNRFPADLGSYSGLLIGFIAAYVLVRSPPRVVIDFRAHDGTRIRIQFRILGRRLRNEFLTTLNEYRAAAGPVCAEPAPRARTGPGPAVAVGLAAALVLTAGALWFAAPQDEWLLGFPSPLHRAGGEADPFGDEPDTGPRKSRLWMEIEKGARALLVAGLLLALALVVPWQAYQRGHGFVSWLALQLLVALISFYPMVLVALLPDRGKARLRAQFERELADRLGTALRYPENGARPAQERSGSGPQTASGSVGEHSTDVQRSALDDAETREPGR
jgi:hypothetical protein